MHGVIRNDTEEIAFGLYIGYQTDVDRKGYLNKSGKREFQDRFDVYSKGVAPQLYPSMDRVELYPLRFQCYHSILGKHIDGRMDKTSTQYDYSKRQLKRKGPIKFVPHLVENPPVDYTPPPLSRRAQEMLVGIRYWDQFFGPVSSTENAQAMV